MDKKLMDDMAVQAIMGLCDLKTPEAVEAFEAESEELAKQLSGVALYGATGADESDDEATYTLQELAKASFALDMASSAVQKHLESKLAAVAMRQVLEKALLGDFTDKV